MKIFMIDESAFVVVRHITSVGAIWGDPAWRRFSIRTLSGETIEIGARQNPEQARDKLMAAILEEA